MVVLAASLFAVLSTDRDAGDVGLSVSYALQVQCRPHRNTTALASRLHAHCRLLTASQPQDGILGT